MNKRTTMIVMLAVAVSAVQAAVIVQWGEDGGNNTIVDGVAWFDNRVANDYSASVTTTYSDSQVDAIADPGYYDLNPSTRSPLFQLSSSSSTLQSGQVQNVSAYDRFRLVSLTGANPKLMETMVVWDDFLTSDNEVTKFNWFGYSAVADATDLYFIIKKGGSWYASLGASWTGSAAQTVGIADAGTATWSAFTPITGGAGTIGSVAAIDMTGVTAVGTYMVATDATGGNLANYNGYFQAQAIPEPATFGLFAIAGGAMLVIRRKFNG